MMKDVDYIIVGCGLASIAFCEQLRAHNKSFVVFNDDSQKSSIVAAGLYNPVILKRFSEVWQAKEQLALALPLYSKIETELDIKIDYKLPILRRFTSIEEQNKWFTASDKPSLESYLSLQLIKNDMTDAVMFGPDGNNLLPAAVLYKKNILGKIMRTRKVKEMEEGMVKDSQSCTSK